MDYIANVSNSYAGAILLVLSLIGDKSVEYGQMMAATVMMMLPVILLYFCAQKYFDEGITITELK